MKTLTTLIKVLSLIAGGSAYAGIIPEKWMPLATLIFLCASSLKDVAWKIADWLDNGKVDGSYKLPILFLCAGVLAFGAVGCAGLNRQAFNAENAAAVTADAGMRTYGVYWEKAWADTNAFHTTKPALVNQRREVENISVKIGGGIALCESLRASYATNSAVEPQLRAALAALSQNTGLIVPYVNSFLTINTNFN